MNQDMRYLIINSMFSAFLFKKNNKCNYTYTVRVFSSTNPYEKLSEGLGAIMIHNLEYCLVVVTAAAAVVIVAVVVFVAVVVVVIHTLYSGTIQDYSYV